MILFTQITAVLQKYLNDDLRILCLSQFFPRGCTEFAEKSLSIPGSPDLWPPCRSLINTNLSQVTKLIYSCEFLAPHQHTGHISAEFSISYCIVQNQRYSTAEKLVLLPPPIAFRCVRLSTRLLRKFERILMKFLEGWDVALIRFGEDLDHDSDQEFFKGYIIYIADCIKYVVFARWHH